MSDKFFHKIVIKCIPASANRHTHWRVAQRERERWHYLVDRALSIRPAMPIKAAKVTCIRGSTRVMDYDNLVYSFKPLLDGLVKAGILIDDSMKVITERFYGHVKTDKAGVFMSVEIQELDYVEQPKKKGANNGKKSKSES